MATAEVAKGLLAKHMLQSSTTIFDNNGEATAEQRMAGVGGPNHHSNNSSNNISNHNSNSSNNKVNDSFVSMEDAQDSVSIHSIALSQRTFPDNTGIPSSHVSITHMPPSLLHAYHLPGGPGGGSSGSAPLWKGKKNDALRALDQGALDTIHVTKLGELGW